MPLSENARAFVRTGRHLPLVLSLRKKESSMKVIPRARWRNPLPLPLFEWADSRPQQSLPYAALKLARRYRLNPLRAHLIAELAGFNLEGRE